MLDSVLGILLDSVLGNRSTAFSELHRRPRQAGDSMSFLFSSLTWGEVSALVPELVFECESMSGVD